MLLILTHAGDATADYLCSRLRKSGIQFTRIDSDSVISQTRFSFARGLYRMEVGPNSFVPSDISNVWFRRPRALSVDFSADEAELRNLVSEWSEAFEGFLAQIPIERWINHPSANVRASHKIEQLTRARQFGMTIPKTLLTQDTSELKQFWIECHGQMIVKPLASGFLERVHATDDSHIYTNSVPEEHLNHQALARCPTLFQERVDKSVDVRLTILDGTIDAIALQATEPDGTQRLDIRRNDMVDVEYRRVEVPTEIRQSLISYLQSYQLRFAAVDMAIDCRGKWIFFEVNPNGQWAWLDLVGVSDIAGIFIEQLKIH